MTANVELRRMWKKAVVVYFKVLTPWNSVLPVINKEIPYLLWNLKVHKGLPLVPILSQMHPVHKFPNYFPNIHSNIILSSYIFQVVTFLMVFRQKLVRISHLSYACYIVSTIPEFPEMPEGNKKNFNENYDIRSEFRSQGLFTRSKIL
jgi:hypothetical protein